MDMFPNDLSSILYRILMIYFINYRVFKSYLDSFVMVFINDIFFYFKSQADHTQQLMTMFQKLREVKLYIKFPKCEF